MRAVTWHGKRDVRVDTVPDPTIQEPTDAIVRITSTGLFGSDLHLYEVMTPYMAVGDVLGHEPMGIVEAVGSAVTTLMPGDRVVIPANIACGSCFMCDRGLHSQCETTQVRDHHAGAEIFGYSSMYGSIPGAQAEYLRVPHAQFGAIGVPDGPPDDRYLFLSDVLPTAWQSVVYAGVGPGDTLVVLGLGPIGDMVCRVARHRGVSRIIGVDLVPERLARVTQRGIEVVDLTRADDIVAVILEMTDGRGADAVVDAVGLEANGSPAAQAMQTAAGLLPDPAQRRVMETVGVDRLAALHASIGIVRRGGTISVTGLYSGAADPLPMVTLFDKQIQVRMGQVNVRRWVTDLLPLLDDDDVLGVDTFASHHLPLADAPFAYDAFQKKLDGTVKVVFAP